MLFKHMVSSLSALGQVGYVSLCSLSELTAPLSKGVLWMLEARSDKCSQMVVLKKSQSPVTSLKVESATVSKYTHVGFLLFFF